MIFSTANLKAKKCSQHKMALNNLVKHHLIDMKMIRDISVVYLVGLNKASKHCHHGCNDCNCLFKLFCQSFCTTLDQH